MQIILLKGGGGVIEFGQGLEIDLIQNLRENTSKNISESDLQPSTKRMLQNCSEWLKSHANLPFL